MEEKDARRDAMAAAAANREKAWDKKITKGQSARRQEEKKRELEANGTAESFEIQNEETMKVVEDAKRSEQKLAQVITQQ